MAKPHRKLPEFPAQAIERFQRYIRVEPTGCWIWTGAVSSRGYGAFTFRHDTYRTNRVAYRMFKGTDPGELLVCHNCPAGDNPLCVNPDHLFLGTDQDNITDCELKGRRATGERHPSKVNPGCHAGTLNGRSKVTPELVRRIREEYAAGGISQPELGVLYGVSHSVIGRIIRRQRWAHVA